MSHKDHKDDHKKNHEEIPAELKEAILETEKEVTLKDSEYLQLKAEAAKAQEHWDRCLRLQADFDNMRKRLEKEKQDFIKFANEGIIVELLNILDELEKAVEAAEAKPEQINAFLKGVEMILAHLYDMLKEYGVKPIVAQGTLFDPNYHEALMQSEDDTVAEHTVVEELQKGYVLNERVIRTAKVRVSKKSVEKK